MRNFPPTIERHFSRASGTYDAHAQPQQHVAARVLSLLPVELNPGRILEIGCGTGHLTALLRERYPDSEIMALDCSPLMITRAHERLRGRGVVFVAADILEFSPTQGFDLVISSSALHWVTPLEDAFMRIRHHLSAHGTFLCGIMLRGTLNELHALRAELAPNKAPRAQLVTEQECQKAILDADLALVHCEFESFEMHYRDARTLLRTLHEQGVTGGEVSRGAKPLSRKELVSLVSSYDRKHAAPGGVRATYQAGYFLGQRRTS